MAFSHYNVGLDSATISQIRSVSHNQAVTHAAAYGSGEAAPAAYFQGQTEPSSSIQTTDLQTLLALNSSTIIVAGHTVTSANCDVQFRERTDGGIYASGTSHTTLRCSATTLVTIDSISGTIGESATADFTMRYHGATPGSAAPVSEVGSQTIASAATLIDEFVLQKVVINGTTVPELQSVTITPNVTVVSTPGVAFPVAFFITEVAPTVEVVCGDSATATGILEGTALSAGGVVCYFAQRTAGGTITADGSAVHISVTGATGIHSAPSISTDDRGTGTSTITINPLTLTAATDTAIS